MQLKGLVRFFTILLIVYSIYELSFTWVVRSHEKKLETQAHKFVRDNYSSAETKFPSNKDSQEIYSEFLNKVYQSKLDTLKKQTSDDVLTYGPTGKINYKKAKESELNLGLDLQGGMNVTLEVEMSGLLRALANNSRDPIFIRALDSANKQKANSGRDFITLFVDAYQATAGKGRLAGLFSAANPDKIKFGDNDDKVSAVLHKEANDAFDRTYRVLRTRIDQFGVAQPNINPDRDKSIITVELPGIQDPERVRKQLQSSANLQFWEVYTLSDIVKNNSLDNADKAFFTMMGGKVKDTTNKKDSTKIDSTKTKTDTTKNKIAKTGDTTQFAENLGTAKNDTGKATQAQTTPASVADDNKKHLGNYIAFSTDQQGRVADAPNIGLVKIKDTALVRGYLEAPGVKVNFPSDLVWMYGMAENDAQKKAEMVPLYGIKTYGKDKARIEGDAISDAGQDYDQITGKVEVKMSMKSSGAKEWAKMTGENVGKFIAIAMDNIIYSAPRVNGKIEGGNSSISGNFTEQEAQDLANVIKGGKLPAPAKIVQEQQVGPTLGQKALTGGTYAFLISFVVIFTLMLIYYNTSGWIANIALILNLLFTIGVLTGLGATLTAPGIAGLVLTIGMAVDTNVIIYERIKEELTRGKGYIPAINEGYKRSLPPVLDAHVTTLLTAIILFYFGLGPVKGFATTQILGILLSLFCGILVSRWVTEWFTNKKRHLEYFTGISKRIFKHASFKFIQYRKVAYIISIFVLIAGVSAFFNGFDQGVEFEGGRSYTVRFDKAVNVEQIRNELKTTFEGESPLIKTVGDAATLDITTSYLIKDTRGTIVDSLVENKLMEGLKNHLPAGITYEQFDRAKGANGVGKIGSKTVLPTISEELKRGAIKATAFAILVIFLYIFIRFRDWRYSLGTIVALLHDVLVTLAVFSFARTIVPFPLEIDQHFIAAILTVIGFSMNDTVIVFDRIREYSHNMRDASKETIINSAINDTLSRTIMTSLTVFLTILILFIVGGEVTKGFAFAMLVGVITGTYSSIFVAAPVLVDLGRKKALGKTETAIDTKAAAKPVVAKS